MRTERFVCVILFSFWFFRIIVTIFGHKFDTKSTASASPSTRKYHNIHQYLAGILYWHAWTMLVRFGVNSCTLRGTTMRRKALPGQWRCVFATLRCPQYETHMIVSMIKCCCNCSEQQTAHRMHDKWHRSCPKPIQNNNSSKKKQTPLYSSPFNIIAKSLYFSIRLRRYKRFDCAKHGIWFIQRFDFVVFFPFWVHRNWNFILFFRYVEQSLELPTI